MAQVTTPDEESWQSWTARLTTELSTLGPGAWMTFVVHVDSGAAIAEERARARKGWRRALAPPPPPPTVPDVFIQSRVLEGVLALECIADAEFEGVTDLTVPQQETLESLGWERDGSDPDFSATFGVDEAADAADLIATSLRVALGAAAPSKVDVRRSSTPTTAPRRAHPARES